MPRVASPRHRRSAMEQPAMEHVLEQAPGHESNSDARGRRNRGRGAMTNDEEEQRSRASQIRDHGQPVIVAAVDQPLGDREQNAPGRERFSHVTLLLMPVPGWSSPETPIREPP